MILDKVRRIPEQPRTCHCQLILLPLGSKEPIRHFYLLFELFNLCCLFSHPFLKSGDHRIFRSGRGMSLRRNLDFCLMSLPRAQVDDAGFDGLVLIQPGRRDSCCLSNGFEGDGALLLNELSEGRLCSLFCNGGFSLSVVTQSTGIA
jgi:hypothetical protein